MILGISFDTVAEQKHFAEDQSFPYRLLADVDKTASRAYQSERQPGEQYFEHGIPKRITYLIDPEGAIRKTYDVEGSGADLATHADEVLNEIRSAS